MVLADLNVQPWQAWEYCPREALRRVSKILKDEFDLVCCIVLNYQYYVTSLATNLDVIYLLTIY
jgi:hypothetical protein